MQEVYLILQAHVSIPKTVSGGLQRDDCSIDHHARQYVSIPKTVSGGLQQELNNLCNQLSYVSIPKTVSGGLQLFYSSIGGIYHESFNTEDGIGRATTSQEELQEAIDEESFNTEDGIGRATTGAFIMTFTNSNMFQYRRRYREGYNYDAVKVCHGDVNVSIPKTVSGGLQLYD